MKKKKLIKELEYYSESYFSLLEDYLHEANENIELREIIRQLENKINQLQNGTT